MVLRVVHSVPYHSRLSKWNIDKRKVILIIHKSPLELIGRVLMWSDCKSMSAH